MGRLKIAVYATAKNESEHVKQFVDSTVGADYVVVTDTGSTDGTPDLLRDAGVDVRIASVVPWRFDTGFNTALANVPADADVCVKLDLDEVLTTNDGTSWRDEIDKLWTDKTIQMRYWYVWTWHVRGKVPATQYRTQNIHARTGCIWRHPGHTALYTYSQDRHKMVDTNVLEIHHYMTKKQRPDYLNILSLALTENRCPRTMYYLAREQHTHRKYKECITLLLEYLDHPQATWVQERSAAMRLLALCSEALGDNQQAMIWIMRAQGTLPGVRELHYELLRILHKQGDFLGGYWAGIKCLSLTERNPLWNGQASEAWFDMPYVYMAICAWHIDKRDAAVGFLKKALEINPASKAAAEFALTSGINVL